MSSSENIPLLYMHVHDIRENKCMLKTRVINHVAEYIMKVVKNSCGYDARWLTGQSICYSNGLKLHLSDG